MDRTGALAVGSVSVVRRRASMLLELPGLNRAPATAGAARLEGLPALPPSAFRATALALQRQSRRRSTATYGFRPRPRRCAAAARPQAAPPPARSGARPFGAQRGR